MAKPILEIDRLRVEFTKENESLTALSEVSLHIRPGETLCLVGESGSGKTILSKAILRLVEFEGGSITHGTIRLGQEDVTRRPQKQMGGIRGRKAAMVFQEPMAAFDPLFPVGKQIAEAYLRHNRSSYKEAWEHAARLLGKVGIPEPGLRMKQYPGELSGGMLQRAMIAMALSCAPDLLIADEPTTALDVTIQSQILTLLKEIQKEYGMSILFVTHDLGVAAEIADRVAVLYAGGIVEIGEADALLRTPLHPYTKGLIGSVTGLETPRGSRLPSIEGSIPSLAEPPSGCRFHPRCPHAVQRCAQSAPPLEEIAGREAACWLAGELRQKEDAQAAEASPDIVRGRAEFTPAVIRPDAAAPPEENTAGGISGDRTPLFSVHGLRKTYRLGGGFLRRPKGSIYAVDDVTFTIREGETFGLVGESGSGKSTLGRTLLHLEPPTEGDVLFAGKEISAMSPSELRKARKQMQVIFQDPYGSLNPRWTVGQCIGEPLAVHGTHQGKERRDKVSELLASVGLPPSAGERYPHEFSGGQRQRIGIARAMALQPRFILADEAVSALDVSVQAQILNLLQELRERENLTYLFIGHGLHAVRHMSDRIGVMYLGKLVETAPSDELFRHPAHPYTAALLASVPRRDRSGSPERVRLAGEIPSPANPPSGCRFHTRCPGATALCREVQPEWIEVGPGHTAACHYPL
ncbi:MULTISPECIES: ABC transporter ATP-binding protein [unclassified Paenibacillus]|uniref:ABC transporter ATP-binding protein n=1 Tax=unclassified Paenibacillus TaxID=185978 RepID=UPI00020D6835|nr:MULTISPECIES: ABC transporter ATP-binding protein [unclassified Paenibacillus]EGL17773.1 putative phosphonate C-P lyase system protein PhnK [Paenibacillus sp. HGF7]EPD81467.1 oligopeptide/dipeptide ABC transporter, ATP-binding protein domain [Paenibacillus sp. HGH0039]